MQLSKQELRKKLKFNRLSLSEADRSVKSQEIVDKMYNAIDWSQVNNIHIFEPIKELGEVDISSFEPPAGIFTTRKVDSHWEITPKNTDSDAPDNFDVVIVPMLGFNESLHRIGYGGGYYDKFLATQNDAKKIGVCFETGYLDKLPVEDHDIPMDIIVTEDKVRR